MSNNKSRYGSGNHDDSENIITEDGRKTATYFYKDKFGRVIIENDRFENTLKKKWFIPRWMNTTKPQDREKDEKDWYYKKNWPFEYEPPMVLYRLPELVVAAKEETVFITEGEKDADNVAALGLVATTNVCGATSWESSYNEFFRDRTVVILEDNDPVGESRSRLLKDNLKGIAASVKVVGFQDLPPKGDVSDWLASGKTKGEFLQYVSEYKPRIRFNFSWADLLEPNGAKKQWLIKDAFGEGEFTLVSGLPGCGKSVVMTDAACHVAAGVDWHGRAVKQGLVIYFAAERKSLTERRVLAWRERHNIKDEMPLAIVNGPLALSEKPDDDAAALVEAIKDAEAMAGLPCVWIVLDTLTRTYGGGDQNASKDMGRYVKAVDALIRGTGAHVTVVHHTTWDGQRGKGAIDLDGAVDASFLVKNSGGSYCVSCDGANDMDEGPILHYKLANVDFGEDQETGERIGAPVVVATEAPSDAENLLKGQAGDVLAALKAAIAAKPHKCYVDTGQSSLSERIGASVEDWRKFYGDMFGQDKTPDTMRKAFNRQKEKLETANIIDISGSYAYLKEQKEHIPF